MTAVTLKDAKLAVRAALLGRHGVHAVGVRRSEDAVCVYVEPTCVAEVEVLRDKIESIAGGHKLLVIPDQQAVSH